MKSVLPKISFILASASLPIFATELRTPSTPSIARIHGPTIYGERPGAPFLYTVPATGDRPITIRADGLPQGLALDGTTGRIMGSVQNAGSYDVTLTASNAKGEDHRHLRIVIGDQISLTPALGWNSWNCWAGAVDQEKILRSAKAMISSGLAQHGWSYINIDDTWQGKRTGADHALQPNEKFPDLKGLCDSLHAMGLKAGIYSTPWLTSYAKYPGGSSDSADGAWGKDLANDGGHRHGKVPFAEADARQWAAWGFDYLKYDWNPVDVEHVKEMSLALRHSGRDIVFSLSNTSSFENAADYAQWANSWRTTCDIFDHWATSGEYWQHGVSEIGFNQDRWAPYAGPGHWNDPDMLVVGWVGWGHLHPSGLTEDEQYSHITLWAMLSAPMIIGCDLEHLDAFTLNLLSNDEILAVDQDALGKQAVRIATSGPVDVYLKPLEDGSRALAFFNRDSAPYHLEFNKLSFIGFKGPQRVRDLWRGKDLPTVVDLEKTPLVVDLPAHGAELYKLSAP